MQRAALPVAGFCPNLASTRKIREELPMDVIPLREGFGAELRGVTLSDVAASDAAYAAVRAAFEEHSVLVFRDQEVSDDVQLAFSRRFGPPETTKVGSMGTGSHFVILSTFGPDGKVVPSDHRQQLRAKANQLWHTDSSFKRVPALTSILSARIIPEHGGETEFVSMRLAFERLDKDVARRLENSFAWHSYAHSRARRPPCSRRRRRSTRCRRCAGAWSGAIRSTAAARCISPPMLTASRAWMPMPARR
jgi:alpha-ketoglutarate-dependent taurine dioxygenase